MFGAPTNKNTNETEEDNCISGLVVEYIVAIDVTRVRFPADAFELFSGGRQSKAKGWEKTQEPARQLICSSRLHTKLDNTFETGFDPAIVL